jgi:hypothetical protein
MDNVDMSKSLQWKLIPKYTFESSINSGSSVVSESFESSGLLSLGDELTTFESSINSGSSGLPSATLEVQNILNNVLPISNSQPPNNIHLTTPIIDIWEREVQIDSTSSSTPK